MNASANLFIPPKSLDVQAVYISTYSPRQCGIATYTKDLTLGINNLNPERLAEIIAMDDQLSEGLKYPWEVSHRIRQNEWADYEKVLDYLNNSVIDVVVLQHEFGIFGGPDGEMIVDFVNRLEKPLLVTFHSILENPSANQKRVIQALAAKANVVVVMLSVAGDILHRTYDVPENKIIAIHHGAPDVPFASSDHYKAALGLEGKTVMTSINLIGPGRGLEYAIQALPAVVKSHPDFIYLVVGKTHPVVLKESGEAYRQQLEKLVSELRLENNVRFINEYVSLDELVRLVQASDFYITPYENMEMISSGSLAYAIAAGKVCISTSYRYASEMLAGQRGYLVEPKNPSAIAEVLLRALDRPAETERVRRNAYALGRKMTWDRVAFRYLRIMDYLVPLRKLVLSSFAPLRYINFMTDDIGILEHSMLDGKNYLEGYATDDNARALIVALERGNKRLAKIYLDFLMRMAKDHKIYCDANENGVPYGEPGLGDWFGRAFWAAGFAMNHAAVDTIYHQAEKLVKELLPSCAQVHSPRTHAFILLGLANIDDSEWGELAAERQKLRESILGELNAAFRTHSAPGWEWLETSVNYANPIVPYALLEAGRIWNDNQARALGLEMLDFLISITFDVRQNHFRFVGNKGWLEKHGQKADFDEQPLEAGSTVLACCSAFQITGNDYYREMAKKAFSWFHGDNIQRRPLYNAESGSVYDGIVPDGVNLNQGAESTLAYLLAYDAYVKLQEEGAKPSDQFNQIANIRTVIAPKKPEVGAERGSQPRGNRLSE